jgi:hypothetical protein
MPMPSYDNDAMAVTKGTDNDGVVVASAEDVVATVQCMRSCEDQHSENKTPVQWSVQAESET